ncbi:hypothetical protein GT354_27530, partial [Streptomyces sp. SID3343]|nr:hypothetical protein [Streptomyces sp. SID3343]
MADTLVRADRAAAPTAARFGGGARARRRRGAAPLLYVLPALLFYG